MAVVAAAVAVSGRWLTTIRQGSCASYHFRHPRFRFEYEYKYQPFYQQTMCLPLHDRLQ